MLSTLASILVKLLAFLLKKNPAILDRVIAEINKHIPGEIDKEILDAIRAQLGL